jgi:organic radical activating enzyme
MFGKNKILKPEIHDGLHLDVQEIFPTFQGEGPYVGYPAVFVRLGGCNLACDFCDTEFDSYKNHSVEKIVSEVLRLAKNDSEELIRKLVVITGGEPLRQPIEFLCKELIALGFLVQIETNGTLFRELPKEVQIICSPKITNETYHQIRPDLLKRINAFKFIISKTRKSYSEVVEIGQSRFKTPIYLQPMDEYEDCKNQENVSYSLELANKHGYRISLQSHKILKIK